LSWKLTVRHGSKVDRDKFETLEAALGETRAAGARVLAEGNLGTVSAFRDYTPDKRVAARIELSSGGLFGARGGGIDLMGDGSVVAYSGAIRKQPLEAETLDQAIDALGSALGD
jgi:hypothetical protein